MRLDDSDPRKANRTANCAADGLPSGFVDPAVGTLQRIDFRQ